MFIWDSGKARRNLKKHGVSFGEAATAFVDAGGLDGDDIKHSLSEQRYFRVARAATDRILTIIYTIRRLGDGKEAIRIISARIASRKERQAYARQ